MLKWEALLLVIWFVFPFFVPYFIAQIPHDIAGIYVSKYTTSAMPALYILAAAGLEKFALKRYLYPVFIIILLVITVLSGIGLHKYYTTIEKEQWREATAFIEPQIQESDVVVMSQDYLSMALNHYSIESIDTENVLTGKELQRFREFADEGKSRLWFIQNEWTSTQKLENMLQTFKADSIIVYKEFVQIKVYLFDLTEISQSETK